MGTATIVGLALVDIGASHTVTFEASVAFTLEAVGAVGTGGVYVAIVETKSTFIQGHGGTTNHVARGGRHNPTTETVSTGGLAATGGVVTCGIGRSSLGLSTTELSADVN